MDDRLKATVHFLLDAIPCNYLALNIPGGPGVIAQSDYHVFTSTASLNTRCISLSAIKLLLLCLVVLESLTLI